MRKNISQTILEVLEVSGVLAMAVLAPNAIQLFKRRHSTFSKRSLQKKINRSKYYLNEKKLIGVFKKNGKEYVQITEAGRKRAIEAGLNDIKISKPVRWDKKWRLVIFDIPARYKVRAETFRRKLKEIGFIMLQKSVWIHPYQCEDQIEVLRDIYEVRPFIRMILAERVDGTRKLKEAFNL